MTQKELIRQEIERNRQAIRVLNEHTAPEQMSKTCAIFQYSDSIFSELLSFIDSLPEETCKESLQVQETCKENTDSFTNLEEAAEEYAIPFNDTTYGVEYSFRGFIAGAKWQAEQLLKGSPLPEDTILFQKGVEEGRRLEREDRNDDKLPRYYGD